MESYKKVILGSLLLVGLLFLAHVAQAQVEIQQQIEALKSNLPRARQQAILNLLKFRVPETIRPIIIALSDPDPYVRYTAAWAFNPYHVNQPVNYDDVTEENLLSGTPQLTPSNSKEIVRTLLNALPESDFWVHREILASLFEIQRYQLDEGLTLDQKARPIVLMQFEHPDPDIRAGAAQNMSLWKGDPLIEAQLRKAFTDDVWRIRLSALSYLKEDLTILSEAVLDPRFEVRFQAVEFLRENHKNDPRKIDLLIQALQDPSMAIVFPAIEGLVSTKSDNAIIPLLLSEEKVKLYAPSIDIIGEAIKKITGRPIESVKKMYHPKMEKFVLKTRPLKKPNTDLLMRKLKSGQAPEILYAAKELQWKQSEHKALLLEEITNRNPRLRFAFLDELRVYVARNYIEPKEFEAIFQGLTNAIKDPNPHVRKMAIDGIMVFLENENYKNKVIVYLSKVFQEYKDLFVTKKRILYYAHIWGTNSESITLAPEFQ